MQQYMVQIIENLEKLGYRKLNPDSNNVYGRAQGDTVYVVVIGNKNGLDADMLVRFNNRIVFDISMQNHKAVKVLNILITPDGMFDEQTLEIVRRVDGVWLFTEDCGRLYIFENQPADFDGLYEIIDKKIIPANVRSNRNLANMFGVVTPVLVAINILVYIAGKFVYAASGYYLEYRLAINADAVRSGEYYRLLTAVFTHFDMLHLFGNMVVLIALGAKTENILGRVTYAVAYICLGLVASCMSFASCVYGEGYSYAAGASGAIFGLLGILVAIAVMNGGHVKDLSFMNMLTLFVLTIVNGYISTGVDNVAHISGFMAGVICGFLLMLTNQKVVNRSRL